MKRCFDYLGKHGCIWLRSRWRFSQPVPAASPARKRPPPTPRNSSRKPRSVIRTWASKPAAQAGCRAISSRTTPSYSAEAQDNLVATLKELNNEARKFDGMQLPPDVARKLKLLKLAVPPAPSNPAEREELTKLTVKMESDYGKFEYCPEQGGADAAKKNVRVSATSKRLWPRAAMPKS